MVFKIVYLDDEAELLQMFIDYFTGPKFEIHTFVEAKLAKAHIQSNPPDLLILDHRLTTTTGDQFALEVDQNIPKIMITGDLSLQTKSNFIKIFQKPYNFEELDELLNARILLKANQV